MKRIVTFGEIMLRLKAPGHERLFQGALLEASFGGGEANVAVSLARFGHEASFVSAVSDDPIGDAALSALRAQGVDVSAVRKVPGRTGIYFLETGSDCRASTVTYDRSGSAMARAEAADFDWPAIFAGADWFHMTGITPALSRSAADAALAAVQAARATGIRVSVDLNYRKKLWNYGARATEVMGLFAAAADVIIANEEDIQLGLGILVTGTKHGAAKDIEETADTASYRALAEALVTKYPNIGIVAVTLRESRSADRNGWSACLLGKDGFRRSRSYELDDIVDRVGGGDSFAAGLICALLDGSNEADALEFAVAASALKHTIPGDWNLVSRAEVDRLVAGDGTGRVQR